MWLSIPIYLPLDAINDSHGHCHIYNRAWELLGGFCVLVNWVENIIFSSTIDVMMPTTNCMNTLSSNSLKIGKKWHISPHHQGRVVMWWTWNKRRDHRGQLFSFRLPSGILNWGGGQASMISQEKALVSALFASHFFGISPHHFVIKLIINTQKLRSMLICGV